MNCIFCKMDSQNSKSVEHIIPESLWNTKQILPAGIVCDKCNNYFSRKVEKPFLCSPDMKALRFHQAIPSKKGKIPSVEGMVSGSESPIKAHRSLDRDDVAMFLELDKEQIELVMEGKSTALYLPKGFEKPTVKEASRFLAKVALEAMAQRLIGSKGGIEYIVSEEQFDPIRNHARRGHPKDWSYVSRRIYCENEDRRLFGHRGQIVHEYDFLQTDWGEIYFVLVLFGVEMTINIGGPSIEGYEKWLNENNNKSPLYSGKNEFCQE